MPPMLKMIQQRAYKVIFLSFSKLREDHTMSAFHLMIQVDTSTFFLLNAKKDKTMFLSICVIKWKVSSIVGIVSLC